MTDILNKICEKKRIELIETKKRCSFASLEKIIQDNKNRGFKNVVLNAHKQKKNNIIAEIKKASPSAGIIIQDYFPESIAVDYEKAGVGAISILTETFFFNGSLEHLSLINQKSNLPIIRKDFIIDPYQILESKVYKADAILLIATILSDNQINEFIDIADKFGLDCLVETHTEEEIKRARLDKDTTKKDYLLLKVQEEEIKERLQKEKEKLKTVEKKLWTYLQL